MTSSPITDPTPRTLSTRQTTNWPVVIARGQRPKGVVGRSRIDRAVAARRARCGRQRPDGVQCPCNSRAEWLHGALGVGRLAAMHLLPRRDCTCRGSRSAVVAGVVRILMDAEVDRPHRP